VLHGENSDCKTTIECAADWNQWCLFSLQTPNTITGLENYCLLAAKPRPDVNEGNQHKCKSQLDKWKEATSGRQAGVLRTVPTNADFL